MLCINPITYPLVLNSGTISELVLSGNTHHSKHPTVELSYGCQVFDEETSLPLAEEQSFLGLYFNLGNHFHYSFPCSNLPEGTLHKGHYMFMYMPKELCQYDLKRGTTTSFRLNFDKRFLKEFAQQFPVLNKLLTCVERGIPHILTAKPPIMTDNMYDEIAAIIYSPYTKTTRDVFLYTKVFDLLLLCLEQATMLSDSEKHLNHKIEHVRDYILSNLHTSLTLGIIAHQIDVDPRTLMRNFKKAYSTTVMNFIFEERMKKAITLLRDNNKSISETATLTGYRHISNFTKAFSRKFGYPPGKLLHTGHH